MAKLPLDLSKFKKVASDEHTTTLSHYEGHEIKIAHKALSAKMKDQLAKMPQAKKEKIKQDKENPKLAESKKTPSQEPRQMFAEGSTDVEPVAAEESKLLESGDLSNSPNLTDTPQDAPTDAVASPAEGTWDKGIMHGLGSVAGGALDDVRSAVGKVASPIVKGAQDFAQGLSGNDAEAHIPASVEQQMGQPQTPPPGMAPEAPSPMDQAAQQPAPEGPDPVMQAQQKEAQAELAAGNSQIAGIKHEAAARGDLGQQQAKIEEQHLQQIQQQSNEYHNNYAQLDQERQNFQHDIQNGHIDPDRYLAHRSTGTKISNTIGLILGGIGSAITGQENPAMKLLKQHVDNDIDAQKAELGKKENLLSMNMKQFGNLHDAMNMTRIMMGDQVKSQLEAAAGRAQTPIEKARAEQAVAQVKGMQAQIQGKLAMGMALQANQKKMMHPDSDPSLLVPQLVDKAHQSEAFKHIEVAQNVNKIGGRILEDFDKAAKANTGLNRLSAAVKHPRENNALKQLLATTVTELTGSGRQAEFENIEKNLIPNQYDTAKDIETKKQALKAYLEAKTSAPQLKAYGIDLSKFNSTKSPTSNLSPQHQKFLDFAKTLPTSDPRRIAILKKLGM